MTHQDPNRPVKGVRGFELDLYLAFARTLPPAEAEHALRGWGMRTELYGQGADIRGARVTGPLGGEMSPDLARALLRAGLEGGLLRYAEVGLHGFLRSAEGLTDWVPWRRTAVLSRSDVERVLFEEGVRYVLE